MFLHFFCTTQVETIYQKILSNSCLFLSLHHRIQKTCSVQVLDFTQQNSFLVMNKIKLV